MSNARNNAYPDLATTMAIATELVGSVEDALADIPAFIGSPSAAPISSKLDAINATLAFMGLRAAQISVEATLSLAKFLEKSGGSPSEQHRNALTSLLQLVIEYLNAAAAGHIKPGTVFHSGLLDVASLLPGFEAPSRSQMFLPIWPPCHHEHDLATPEFADGVQPYLRELREAVEKYTANPSGDLLGPVRASLVTIETKRPPAQVRNLVATSIAYLDTLLSQSDSDAADSLILGQIVDLVCLAPESSVQVPDHLISSILEAVSRNVGVSERTRHFAEMYDLSRLASSGAVTSHQVDAAIEAGVVARRAWEDVCGDLARAQMLKGASLQLAKAASVLDNTSLRALTVSFATLVDGIATGSVPSLGVPAIVDGTPTGGTAMRDDIAIFGASLLLAISDQIAWSTSGRNVDRELVDYYKGAVRSVLSGSVPTRNRPVDATALVFPELMEQAAETMKAVESMVDLAFRGDSEENADEAIDWNFQLVRSSLTFMQLERAAELTERIRLKVLDAFSATSPDATARAQEELAAPVMHLNSYLAVAAVAPRHAEKLLIAAETALNQQASKPDEPKESVLNEYDFCADLDLGPIFFSEARAVLADTVFPQLVHLRSNPTDRATLVEVRRGFHTLKGSARMVGLLNLGKLAEAVEHALNLVRDNSAATLSTAMITWIDDAGKTIERCLEPLEHNLPAKVDPRPFSEVCELFRKTGVFPGEDADNRGTPQPKTHPADLQSETIKSWSSIDTTSDDNTKIATPLLTELTSDIVGNADLTEGDDLSETPPLSLSTGDKPSSQSSGTVVSEPLAKTEHLARDPQILTTVPEPIQTDEAPVLSLADSGAEMLLSLEATSSEGNIDKITSAVSPSDMTASPDLSLSLAPAGAAIDHLEPQSTSAVEAMAHIEETIQLQAEETESTPDAPVVAARLADENLEPNAASVPRIDDHVSSALTAEQGGEVEFSSTTADAHANFETLQPAEAPIEVAPPTIPSEPVVTIGSVVLPLDMFNIFVEEASGYVAKMSEQMENLVEGRTRRVDFEFYRMAHALAGMGRTAGIEAVTEVADVLETWSELNRNNDILVSKTSATMLTDAMRHLSWTIDSIANKSEPTVDRWIVDNMRNLISMNQQFIRPASTVERGPDPRGQSAPEAKKSNANAHSVQSTSGKGQTGGSGNRTNQTSPSVSKAAPRDGSAAPAPRKSSSSSVNQGARPNGGRTQQPRTAASRKYKKAPQRPDTLFGAFFNMIGRAVRSAWTAVTGR